MKMYEDLKSFYEESGISKISANISNAAYKARTSRVHCPATQVHPMPSSRVGLFLGKYDVKNPPHTCDESVEKEWVKYPVLSATYAK